MIPDYKYIAVVDHEGCDLTPHFNEAVDFIKEQLDKTNVNHSSFSFLCIVLRESVDRSVWLLLISFGKRI